MAKTKKNVLTQSDSKLSKKSKSESKIESKSESKSAIKSELKSEFVSVTKAELKTALKTESKAESRRVSIFNAESRVSDSDFDGIIVKGANEHNLKNISLRIPRNKITVVTGLSGSGKSSIAFDTIYAEGQRRYVEGLSAYARNFLEQMKKPEVESITGLSPAIAIDQKSVSTSPRSTVGTVTEIYDYLRLLYSKIGIPECPEHHVPVSSQAPQQILEDVLRMPSGSRVYILAPMAQGKKGEFLAEFQRWAKKGFVKAKVDGKFIELIAATKLAKTKTHDIDLVIDQLVLKAGINSRLSESINTALSMSDGRLVVEESNGHRKNYSIHSSCPICGFSFPELEPRLFSFNNPRGACETCKGLGTQDLIEEEQYGDSEGGKVIQNVKYTLKKDISSSAGKSKDKDEDEDESDIVLSDCPDCRGTRLKPEVLNVKFLNKNIAELASMSAEDLQGWMEKAAPKDKQNIVFEKIQKQILSRLSYMNRVGCGYLSLDRSSRTLSGGEAQRIRLATQVGSSLIGCLYVLDEPSIGLHPRDHHRMLEIIGELRDRGNTILMVEHDEDTMRAADYLYDLGPRAGKLGGEILAEGTPDEVAHNPRSVTGLYLRGEKKIEAPQKRRVGNGQFLELKGATGNNLQNVDIKIPLGTLTAVTGVSGSGKSTLIIDTLYKILAQKLNNSSVQSSPYKQILGLENIDKVIDINQRPIGRTPRSTPATYVGLFPLIRDLYAQLPDAKLRGYTPGRFSFNVKGGRCEACGGHGQIRMEMNFLADVFVQCETCNGARYNRETLAVKYNGKSIAEVLAMNVEEALDFFKNHSIIHRKLETLHRVGLDYITLGQSSTTISGGEAQRVKLSKELSKRGSGKTFYILDEPTTGLHFEDIRKLIDLLQELVDQGNTMIVIEHHLDVIKCADLVIDMGPDGGTRGGQVVAVGTPEKLAQVKGSATGQFLGKLLDSQSGR